MHNLINEIVARAKANRQRIVLPEGTEERTLKAANQILTDGIAELILLGNPTPYEIFTVQEAITWFDLKAISKSPACFDIEKLRLINREHIKRIPDMELSKRIGYACDNIGKLAKLFTEEVSTTREIKQKIDAIFAKKSFYTAFEKESKLLQELILQAPYFEKFDEFQTYLIEKSGIKGEPFFKPLRFWLSGTEHCPELALLYPLIKTYLKEIVR